MNVIKTTLPGVLVLEPVVHADVRGYFHEVWNDARHAAVGVCGPFVQDNLSMSRRSVLRGLHLQWPEGQGKLVTVPVGDVFDVAVDVRHGSPTFGCWASAHLSESNHRQLWIPPGFAHGFAVLSETAVLHYKITAPYAPAAEIAIAWDDPDLGIEWPLTSPLLSPRDQDAPRLAMIDPSLLPQYDGT